MSLYQFDSPGKRRKKALSRQVASHVAVETLKAEANLGNVEARLTRLEMRFQEIETEGLSSIAKLGNNISSQMTLLSARMSKEMADLSVKVGNEVGTVTGSMFRFNEVFDRLVHVHQIRPIQWIVYGSVGAANAGLIAAGLLWAILRWTGKL